MRSSFNRLVQGSGTSEQLNNSSKGIPPRPPWVKYLALHILFTTQALSYTGVPMGKNQAMDLQVELQVLEEVSELDFNSFKSGSV